MANDDPTQNGKASGRDSSYANVICTIKPLSTKVGSTSWHGKTAAASTTGHGKTAAACTSHVVVDLNFRKEFAAQFDQMNPDNWPSRVKLPKAISDELQRLFENPGEREGELIELRWVPPEPIPIKREDYVRDVHKRMDEYHRGRDQEEKLRLNAQAEAGDVYVEGGYLSTGQFYLPPPAITQTMPGIHAFPIISASLETTAITVRSDTTENKAKRQRVCRGSYCDRHQPKEQGKKLCQYCEILEHMPRHLRQDTGDTSSEDEEESDGDEEMKTST
jgi:hypothetical protein